MDRKKQIKAEVDRTLASFDRLHHPGTNPYLLTRIRARIGAEERRKQEKSITAVVPYSIRLAVLIFFTVINLISILVFTQMDHATDTIRQRWVSQFAEEYALTADENQWFYFEEQE